MKAEFEWKREDLDMVSVVIRMTIAEKEALLAVFDEASATSPSAADSRAIARPIAIAIKEAELSDS